jgi:hypothetical protein
LLASFAKEYAEFARSRRIAESAVGQITAPAAFRISASAGIEEMLIEELGKAGVKVARTSDVEIKGEYSLEADSGERPESVYLSFRVVKTRKGGPALKEYEARLVLTDLDPYLIRTVVAFLFGVDLPSPVNSLLTVRDAQREIRDVVRPILEPEATPDPNAPAKPPVETEFLGPYGVRIEVKNQDGAYVARPCLRDGPFLFVQFDPEESFRVVLVNESGDEAAADVSMDGISVLRFSKNPKRRFLVAAKAALPVEGWVGDGDDRLREFQVKKFGESVFAELGRANQGELGTISVRMAKCFKAQPKGSPSTELPSQAIGRGTEKAVNVETHSRWIDPGDAVIHIRYRVKDSEESTPQAAGEVERKPETD